MLASSHAIIFITLLARPAVGAVTRARSSSCPLSTCHRRENAASDGTSLLELSSSRAASGDCGPKFTPAHFTCSSCDEGTCEGCNNIVCDLKKCIGKFYSQECWCTKPLNPKINKFFCDSDCTGGLCNQKGLTCKTRESMCKPWWWCKLPPPKEPEGDSFLQKISSRRQAACGKQEDSSSLNARFEKSKRELALLQETSRTGKKPIDDFKFSPGEFVCESALIPPPEEDPDTLAQRPVGFIVFDGDACTGGYFKSKCFCYDKFLYLRGKDPMTSELQCDKACSAGDCAGKTCGAKPPPPLPAPAPPPPLDPLMQELANEGLLRNYGTVMSPVQ